MNALRAGVALDFDHDLRAAAQRRRAQAHGLEPLTGLEVALGVAARAALIEDVHAHGAN